jgi:RHS repeat-associated protein
MRASVAFVVVFVGVTLLSTGAAAQGYLYATGNPSFSSQIPVQNGFIDLNNGNLHIELSLVSHPQRGALQLNERLVYDSRIWQIVNNGSQSWQPTNVPNSSGGWRFTTGLETGTTSYAEDDESYDTGEACQVGPRYEYDVTESWSNLTQFQWTDPQGTSHMFPVETSMAIVMCNGDNSHTKPTGSGYALDSSGYYLVVSQYTNMTIYDSKGNQVYPQIQDTNGNYFSADGNGNLIDTQGNTPILVSTSGNQTYYDVLGTGGTRNRYTATWGTISFSTSFGQYGVAEASGSFSALTQLQLPDGSSYTFNYDSYGELTSVTLPTGGIESFGYATISDAYNNSNRWVTSRVKDGGTTTITPIVESDCSDTVPCQEDVTVTTPDGNDTVYIVDISSGDTANNASQLEELLAFQGNQNNPGIQLANSSTTYTWQQISSSDGIHFYEAPTQISQTSRYPQVSKYTTTLTSLQYGYLPTSVSVWDYYTGTQPTNPTQTTTTSYGYLVNGASLPTQVAVADGGGSQVSQTTYGYDGSSLTATSGLPNHTSVSGSRGNLTSVSQWVNSPSGTIQTTATYDDAGTLLTSTTPLGTTSYGHDSHDTFVTSTTPPTPSSGVVLTTNQSYDASSGVLLSTTDPNGETTSYQNFDGFDRPQQITYPDLGIETLSYTQNQITDIKKVNSQGTQAETQTNLDGYGRTSSVVTYDGSQQYRTDTCYDTNGRIAFASLPYINGGGSNVCSSAGVAYTYDPLNRPTQIAEPDGTTTKVYAGSSVKTTNAIGASRIVQSNVFGQTTAVCEVFTSTLPNGDNPQSCGITDMAGSGYPTTYAYSLANHTTTVYQGSQQRVFTTDSIGRTTSTVEPEVGTTTYSYSYNSTGLVVTRTKPKANQTNAGTTTTTTYQYDALGRIVNVSYSDSTPGKTYEYDTNAGWPWSNFSPTNLKGRMYLAYNASAPAATTYSYNPMGRINEMAECLPSGCGNSAYDKHILYSYDWTGNVTSETDDANGTITYSRSPAGEITSVTSQTYNLTGGAGTAALISNMQYGPFGPTTWQWGNGLSGARYYDGSGRISSQWVCSGSTQVYCSGGTNFYGFFTGWTGSYLTGMTDGVVGQRASLTYDALGRLSAYNVTLGNPGSFSYTYDRYGNRVQQSVTNGSGPAPVDPVNSSTNQISSFSYDVAGNMMNDGVHSYTYDADGNVTAVDGGATAQYTYDALNHRVRWQEGCCTIENVYDAAGNNTALWWTSHVPADSRIFADGQQIAFRGSDGQTYFVHQDWVSTDRMHTDSNGNVAGTWASLPFGDGGALTGTGPGTFDFGRFAGLDGNLAHYRLYNPTAGRWMSPDPYAGSYDPTEPQSLNRYTYVMNRPTVLTDALGLCWNNGAYSSQDSDGNYTSYEDPGDDSPCGGFYAGSIGSPEPGSSDGSSSAAPAAPNNRNCAPAGTPSHTQYALAAATVARLTAQFFSGAGPSNEVFGPDSPMSQVMAQSAGVQDVLNNYYMLGQTCCLYIFHASDIAATGNNLAAQFVGSFRYSIAPGAGGINLSLTNTTSFKSLFFDKGGQWQRYPIPTPYGTFNTPMGNIHQTFNLFIPCKIG